MKDKITKTSGAFSSLASVSDGLLSTSLLSSLQRLETLTGLAQPSWLTNVESALMKSQTLSSAFEKSSLISALQNSLSFSTGLSTAFQNIETLTNFTRPLYGGLAYDTTILTGSERLKSGLESILSITEKLKWLDNKKFSTFISTADDKSISDFNTVTQPLVDITQELALENPSLERIPELFKEAYARTVDYIGKKKISTEFKWFIINQFAALITTIIVLQISAVSAQKDKGEVISKININSDSNATQILDSTTLLHNELIDTFYSLTVALSNKYIVIDNCKVYSSLNANRVTGKLVTGQTIQVTYNEYKRYYISYIPDGEALPVSGWIDKKYAQKEVPQRKKPTKIYKVAKLK